MRCEPDGSGIKVPLFLLSGFICTGMLLHQVSQGFRINPPGSCSENTVQAHIPDADFQILLRAEQLLKRPPDDGSDDFLR